MAFWLNKSRPQETGPSKADREKGLEITLPKLVLHISNGGSFCKPALGDDGRLTCVLDVTDFVYP